MSATLELRGVTIKYGRGAKAVSAVSDVDFSIRSGQVIGIVGESGCGKSTLARAICGLETLTAGTISLSNFPVKPLKLRARPTNRVRIQMVFQNPYASLNPRRRIGDQIEDARRVASRTVGSVAELLADVELAADVAGRFPYQFSGGQRQRIAIARAIAATPDILIGDEPIASLDASLQSRVASLMRNIALKNDAAMIFISHDLAVVRLIADQIAVMYAGQIVEFGSAEQIWNSPQHPQSRRLLSAIPVVDGLGHIPSQSFDDN